MKRFLLVFALLILVILQVMNVTAQESIEPGDTVNGTLTAETYQLLYEFTGNAGDAYEIALESTDFDAFLVIVNSDNTLIDEDDDSGGRLNAQINVTLPADDTYTIIATSLRAYRSDGEFSASGEFTLTLAIDDAPQATVPPFTPTMIPSPTGPLPTPTFLPSVTPTPFSFSASAAGSITFGDYLSGEIDASTFAPVDYEFNGFAGEIIDVALESADFDAYVMILDENGFALVEDDDSGLGTDAFIESYELPYSGNYTVRVTSFDEHIGRTGASGAFTVSLNYGDGTTSATEEPFSDELIAYGDVIENELTFQNPIREYTFDGFAGEVVRISHESYDLDAFLELLDPSGYVIMTNDDNGSSTNAQIGPYVLPQDGRYLIRVNSYDYYYSGYEAAGSFVLRLETVELEDILYDEPVSGDLTEESIIVYRLTAETGDVVYLDLETPGYSVTVRIEGANGMVWNETYGGADQLGPVVIPQAGDYIITVSSYDPQYDITDYTLSVSRIEPITLEVDTTITANFDEAEVLVYSFDGFANQAISVFVESDGSVDTRLTLNMPTGGYLFSDDDGGLGFDPEINQIILPEDGTYTVIVEPYIAGDNGDFTLLVSSMGSVSLDEGAQVVRVSDKNYRGIVTFEAEAGEVVRVGARLLSASGSEPFILVTQNGNEIASQILGKVDRLILEFTVPEDGLVQVGLEDYYYYGAIVEFTLERP